VPIIEVPYQWTPRDYQLPLWEYMEGGGLRSVAVWHRRAGKDHVGVNWTSVSAVQRVGLYWHILPTYAQGRKIVWQGMDRTGRRFLDYFPPDLVERKRDDHMMLELKNKSIWQVIGGDDPNSLVGPNPIGVVFSEFSLQDPACWDLIRPILAENGGWAMFIFTPRGHNHGYQLYKMAKENPDWFCELRTVGDTRLPNGKPVISEEQIIAEVEAGMSEELAQQEFYCSWEAPMSGSYYSREMQAAEVEGRITDKVVYDDMLKVHTAWDLGIGDLMVVWFFQVVGNEAHFIDYLEGSGNGMDYYIEEMRKKPYHYGDHYAPHDIAVRELGTGLSRQEQALRLGVNFTVVPKWSIADGINASRALLRKSWFNQTTCARGLDGLHTYRKEYNTKFGTWSERPVHDWSSHPADGFRTAAVAISGRLSVLKLDAPPRYDLTLDQWSRWTDERALTADNGRI